MIEKEITELPQGSSDTVNEVVPAVFHPPGVESSSSKWTPEKILFPETQIRPERRLLGVEMLETACCLRLDFGDHTFDIPTEGFVPLFTVDKCSVKLSAT
jgi:hypothetical protein